jgi:hypothetical protein
MSVTLTLVSIWFSFWFQIILGKNYERDTNSSLNLIFVILHIKLES